MIALTLIGSDPASTGRCATQRLMLYPGELCRVRAAGAKMRVAAGCAYVTHAGCDIILGRGDDIALDPAKDDALVSALGGQAVIVELCERRPGKGEVLLL